MKGGRIELNWFGDVVRVDCCRRVFNDNSVGPSHEPSGISKHSTLSDVEAEIRWLKLVKRSYLWRFCHVWIVYVDGSWILLHCIHCLKRVAGITKTGMIVFLHNKLERILSTHPHLNSFLWSNSPVFWRRGWDASPGVWSSVSTLRYGYLWSIYYQVSTFRTEHGLNRVILLDS